jgi:hypothetical protein
MNEMPSVSWRTLLDNEKYLVIEDTGPWDQHLTITNGAEQVVDSLAPKLEGRRLFYFDSQGDIDEILVHEGGFLGFAHDDTAEDEVLALINRPKPAPWIPKLSPEIDRSDILADEDDRV